MPVLSRSTRGHGLEAPTPRDSLEVGVLNSFESHSPLGLVFQSQDILWNREELWGCWNVCNSQTIFFWAASSTHPAKLDPAG